MEDRELLERAAKAAGLNIWRIVDADEVNDSPLQVFIHEPATSVYEWNPLTDDGDALRLAVKLRLTVRIDYAGTQVDFPDRQRIEGCYGMIELVDKDGLDPLLTATRRAIVRAAAEIGKAK